MSVIDRYGEDVAATYDADTARTSELDVLRPQVDFLAELAAGSPVLELAIGTGRVAIPLALRGLAVSGIELSPAMVERMRAKRGGDASTIPVTIGDMAVVRAPGVGSFGLVYLVFNTIMNLTTQAEQVACFRNAAAHLAPGGLFVVETMVPEIRRLGPGERFVVFDRTRTHIGIDEYDIANQGMWSHHVVIEADGRARTTSTPFRYAWPAELDLMADLAGMDLRERWADWGRTPFTGESRAHVSVWQRRGDAAE
jgi:SAM-dependent methyltransferase